MHHDNDLPDRQDERVALAHDAELGPDQADGPSGVDAPFGLAGGECSYSSTPSSVRGSPTASESLGYTNTARSMAFRIARLLFDVRHIVWCARVCVCVSVSESKPESNDFPSSRQTESSSERQASSPPLDSTCLCLADF